MTKRRIWLSLMTLSALIVLGLLYWQHSAGPTATPKSNSDSDLIVEATPEAILNHIRELNSPVVLVNFWASWCEPCKDEFPQLLKLRAKLADQGFRLVFVSIDEPRDRAAAEEFLASNHVGFQTFYKGAQSLDFVTQIYPKWEGAVPASLLMNAKLDILEAWEGDATLAEFEERILRHLRGT